MMHAHAFASSWATAFANARALVQHYKSGGRRGVKATTRRFVSRQYLNSIPLK